MRSKKKLILKIVAAVLGMTIFLVAYYAAVVVMGFLRYEDNIKISPLGKASAEAPTGEELTVMTYNVGFGAYSADYSFFMDGGEHARAYSEEAVMANINAAIDVINEAEPEFLFLQEVDIDGTRSHHIDQSKLFINAFEKCDRVTAVNYDSPYLFYPFHEPIGRNKSCIMTFSTYGIKSGLRRSLPIEKFPNNLFDLDRAYSVSRIVVENGKELVLYNLHLSAYTSDGTIADEQLVMLVQDMKSEYEKGNYVIVAGDFNKDLLGDSSQYFERAEGEYTWAQPIKTELIPKGFELYAATNAPTCRNADRAYKGDGTDFVLSVDGMIASANISVLSSETIDTSFANSDHNPVKYEIILKDESSKEE